MSNATIREYRRWLTDPANAHVEGRHRVEQGLADELCRAGLQLDAAAPHDEEAEIAASILNAAGRPVPTAEREPQTEGELAAQILANFRGQR
jgi:hypothetical protein